MDPSNNHELNLFNLIPGWRWASTVSSWFPKPGQDKQINKQFLKLKIICIIDGSCSKQDERAQSHPSWSSQASHSFCPSTGEIKEANFPDLIRIMLN